MIRVMIIDDYPFMRFGLRALLNAEADIEVVAACADGQEVELVDQVEPDVVVTDLSMPVGAENPVTSCDLQILVHEAAEPVTSQRPHGRAGAWGVGPAGGCCRSDR